MKLGYQFNHLCGTVYTQGNVIFTPDGNALLSPVGNRITLFDLLNHSSRTYTFESRKDIETIAISKDSCLFLVIDTDGHSLLINYKKGVVLYRFNFKNKVDVAEFSPDNKYIATSINNQIHIWNTPNPNKREFLPFTRKRLLISHHDRILSIHWSFDSKFLISTSKDLTVRIHSIEKYKYFHPYTLIGHKDHVIGAFFGGKDGNQIYTIGIDGGIFIWGYERLQDPLKMDENNEEILDIKDENLITDNMLESSKAMAMGVKWSTIHKKQLKTDYSKIKSCHHHNHMNILVIGCLNGTFSIYEMPECNMIHTLSITQYPISSIAINNTGEWLAFASKELGQLLVWEWKSETYVLKQQGHYFDINAMDYSPDGTMIVSGADDTKVKLWNTSTGFCFVTLNEHIGPVTDVKFTLNGNAIVSASLDGTLRAYDLNRYKNFRIFTTPEPVQFLSLAIDPSGQLVCAGTINLFHIYVYSMQTGRILDILSGHEGPVTCLAFSPSVINEPILASGSWDHTVRLWHIYENNNNNLIEPFIHQTDVLSLAFRPDGKEICTTTLNGNINFWDVEEGINNGIIEGKHDISGGRLQKDLITAKNNKSTKYFNTACYSADGSCIVAGGKSKYICIYELTNKMLLKKYQLSHNRSLDGMLDILNSKDMTTAGPKGLLNISDTNENNKMNQTGMLAGATRAVDVSKRRDLLEIRTKAVRFSSTGRSWAAATTEGLVIYSLDETLLFDPFDLDENITIEKIKDTLYKENDFTKAILMSLHLNEFNIIHECVQQVKIENIPFVVLGLKKSNHYLERFMSFLATKIEKSIHFEFYLEWAILLLQTHGDDLYLHSGKYLSSLRSLQKSILFHQQDLLNMCNDNQYTLNYLQNLHQLNNKNDNRSYQLLEETKG